MQHWVQRYLIDIDTIYKGFVTGCALTGPSGCAVASEGDTPLDIDAKWQALFKAAYDVTKANASTPLPLGYIRCEYFPTPQWTYLYLDSVFCILRLGLLNGTVLTLCVWQSTWSWRCISPKTGRWSRTSSTPNGSRQKAAMPRRRPAALREY